MIRTLYLLLLPTIAGCMMKASGGPVANLSNPGSEDPLGRTVAVEAVAMDPSSNGVALGAGVFQRGLAVGGGGETLRGVMVCAAPGDLFAQPVVPRMCTGATVEHSGWVGGEAAWGTVGPFAQPGLLIRVGEGSPVFVSVDAPVGWSPRETGQPATWWGGLTVGVAVGAW